MMRRFPWLLGSLVVIACSTGGELFGEGESTSSAASGTGGTTVSSSRSATSTSVQSSASTGGNAQASSTSAEASSTASGGVMTEIPCTLQTCTMGTVCCVHEFNDNLDYCAAPGTCDRGYVQVACNGPNDCAPNEVCCGTFVQNVGYQFIACQPTCDSTSTTSGILMCGDDPNACESSQACYPSGFLPAGHSFCQ